LINNFLSGVLGWGVACLYESTYGRSVAGQFNVDPSTFFTANEDLQLGIIVHEIIHALGFSETRFTAMIDENGNQRVNTIGRGVRTFKDSFGSIYSKLIYYLQTPGLLQIAKTYIDCELLPYGIEMEEYGGDGTVGSHFEKRIYMNDLMTGNVGWFNPSNSYSISPFILTFFDDSGWYKANHSFTYTQSETALWGQNFGCSILKDRCENWTPGNRLGYFCNPQNSSTTCTFNHRGKGYCATIQYGQDLGYYEHLSSEPNVGGPDAQADFCPLIRRYANGDCGATQLASNIQPGEYWGKGSGCFESNLLPSGNSLATIDARCFQYACNYTTNVLRINAAGTWIDCPVDQSYKKITSGINGYSGYIACPQDGFTILCLSNQDVVLDTGIDNSHSCANLFGWFCSGQNRITYSLTMTTLLIVLSLVLI
jgi:hypothetical protein